MALFYIIQEAVRALNRNRMRAFLTALGIIIGVGAVVAMGAVGAGAQKQVADQIASLGSSVIMVFPGGGNFRGFSGGAGSGTFSIDAEDCDAILNEVPNVSLVTPQTRAGGQIVAGALNWQTQIQGANEYFLAIREWTVVSGDNFTASDVRNQAKICLIGQTIVDQLFPDGNDPVGQTIRIKKIPFKVIGVLDKKGQNVMGQDQDDIILAPYTTVMRRLSHDDHIRGMMISAANDKAITQVSEDVDALLRQRHRVPSSESSPYSLRSQTDIQQLAGSTSGVLSILLGSIAGISLIVGGIGIMNIMLVSVAERTREIGLRMALGARRSAIRTQFLLEASSLSIAGGFIGVMLGILAANIISKFAGWVVFVSPQSVAIAVGFSAAVGIFFGIYPAQKASASNPIEALRYE